MSHSSNMLLERLRNSLSSRAAELAFRIAFVLIAMVLILDTIQTAQVIKMFDVEFGTGLWFVCALKIASSVAAVVCIFLLGRGWKWSVWAWASVVFGIALTGVSIGLSTEFLIRWDVALPWLVLFISAVLRTRFAVPWRQAD